MGQHGKYGPLVGRAALIVLLLLAAPAAAACRQALVLAIDVSGSVDPHEHALQRQGLARALLDADVQAAFLADPVAPVRLLIFEWAGVYSQAVLAGWTEIVSAADLAATAAALATAPRAGGGQGTATGQAMLYGGARLAEQGDCVRHTLDISTDGERNSGVTPGLARRQPELRGIVVNGLAIGNGRRPLDHQRETQLDRVVRFLHLEVIQGPDAFVEVADDFEDFARAMRRKLIRELKTPVYGAVPADGSRG